MRRLLISVKEAQEALGVGRNTIFLLLASGELESIKIGRRRLIPEDALTAFVAGRRGQSQAAAAYVDGGPSDRHEFPIARVIT